MGTTRRKGRPPTDEVAHGERKAQIVRCALHHFARRGYAAVSLGEIAEDVGVTKSALYNHVANKEALYTEALCYLLTLITTYLRDAIADPRPFPVILREVLQKALLHPPSETDMHERLRDVFEYLSPEQQAQVHHAHQAYTAAVTALMQRGIDQGSLRDDIAAPVLAHSFGSLIIGFQGRNRLQAGLEADEALVDLVLQLFCQGANAKHH